MKKKKQRCLLIQWEGYTKEEATWQAAADVINGCGPKAREIFKNYFSKNKKFISPAISQSLNHVWMDIVTVHRHSWRKRDYEDEPEWKRLILNVTVKKDGVEETKDFSVEELIDNVCREDFIILKDFL